MEMQKNRKQTISETPSGFNLEKEFCNHAWFPKMTAEEAKALLKGQSAYTYILRKNQENSRKYDISYVNQYGSVCHDTFTLVNPKLGIFLNGQHAHLGKLEKVIRDMMHCERHLGKPFSS